MIKVKIIRDKEDALNMLVEKLKKRGKSIPFWILNEFNKLGVLDYTPADHGESPERNYEH